mmetsp:Transcript_788/g.1690  ORF Transcript_788/g.1690 Transcript_788/m.1690 type:complete len:102 (+) Transcript_788:968-1273(+)
MVRSVSLTRPWPATKTICSMLLAHATATGSDCCERDRLMDVARPHRKCEKQAGRARLFAGLVTKGGHGGGGGRAPRELGRARLFAGVLGDRGGGGGRAPIG